jgi:hypothetical protein
VGYDTTFSGQVTVDPPLSPAEVQFLKDFSETRHCTHQDSPFAAVGGYTCSGRNCGSPGPGVPDFWCLWEATDDGTAIKWNGAEKFYDSEAWMKFLISNFLAPGSVAGPAYLTHDHTLNGVIDAEGEEAGDIWRLIVKGNIVRRVDATVIFPEEPEPVVVKSYVIRGELT